MNEWLIPLISAAGGGISAYIGVRAALIKHETWITDARGEIKELRQAKHDHAGMLTEHEMRITELERWRERG